MAKEKEDNLQVVKEKKFYHRGGGSSGAIYGMGVLGSLIYFWIHATSFWLGVLGIFKAIFWPALIVYKALELLSIS